MKAHPVVAGCLLAMLSWACDSPVKPTSVGTVPPHIPSSGPTTPTGTTIASISPATVKAGSGDIVVTITGTGFKNEGLLVTAVGWTTNFSDSHCCNTWLNTTVLSATQLTAVIPAALLQSPATARIFLETGDSQGISDGVSYPRSNPLSLTVTS
jgi:hypothetical protein